MARRYISTALFLIALLLMGFSAAIADEPVPNCEQLDEKATGDMGKYSLHGEANGPIFFSGISCAIKHRNKKFCAMEMVSFDTTAKVYDYYTGAEIDAGKAYFWLDVKNSEAPILAFGSKENAEKYEAETGGGVILDYTGLTDRKL